MKKRGKLFVFSAPSGSGKTTIVQSMLKIYPDLEYSVSATTRKKRRGETEGKDYFFLSEGDFKRKIKADEFVEWEKFYDYYYGTLKMFVEEKLNLGKSLALEVDVKGAIKIKKAYPNSVLIFISPPSMEVLKSRLINRNTETEEDLKKRIERAEMEMSYRKFFDYNIINKDLTEAKAEVKKIIDKEFYREVINGNKSD